MQTMLIFAFFNFVLSVVTAFVLLIWRSIVSFLLGVYQAGATIVTYKVPFILATVVYCGGLAVIENQETIQIVMDIAYECSIFKVEEIFNAFIFQVLYTTNSNTVFRYNDIIMYFRSLIADAINKIVDVNDKGTLQGVIDIIKSIRDIFTGILRISIDIPSIQIKYFSDAFNRIALLVSNIWVILTDIIISLAKVTFTSEDCLFCGFGQELSPDTCVLTTFAAPSVVIDCNVCHNFECDIVLQWAVFFNWITADIDPDFWDRISDALCCVLNLWKRPVFFIVGIIQGCLDFNELLIQLQEWGIEIITCWDNLLSVITYGQYDDIFAFLFEFIISVVGVVIDGVTDTVDCFEDVAVQDCFEDFPNNCQFDSNGVPIAGLQTCFTILNNCLEVIPLYQPISPVVFDISVYISQVFDLTTCTAVSLIQCILDASSCSGLPDCVLEIEDILTCMSDALPWASPFFDVIIEFLDFLLIALGSIDVVIAELAATIEQVKGAIDSSLSTLDEIAGFFGKRSEGRSTHSDIKKELMRAKEMLKSAVNVKIIDSKTLYVYNFFRCLSKGIRDSYIKDENLNNIDSSNCMVSCLGNTKSCSIYHDASVAPFQNNSINYLFVVSRIQHLIKTRDIKCTELLSISIYDLKYNNTEETRNFFLCLSKYGMIYSVHNFLNNYIPIRYLDDIKSHVYFNKLKNFKQSFKHVKRVIKHSFITSEYWNITQTFLNNYKNINQTTSDNLTLLELYQDYVNDMVSKKNSFVFNENYITRSKRLQIPFPSRVLKTEPNPKFKRMSSRFTYNVNESKEEAKEKISKFLNETWSKYNLTEMSDNMNGIYYTLNKWYKIDYWPSYQTYYLLKNATLNLNMHDYVIWLQGKHKYLVNEGWVSQDRYDSVMKNISYIPENSVINMIGGTGFLRNQTLVLTLFLIGYDLEDLLPSVSYISSFVKNRSIESQSKRKYQPSSANTNLNDEIINLFDFFVGFFGASTETIKNAVVSLIGLINNLDYSFFFENTLVRYFIGRATCTWPMNVDGSDTYNPLCFPLLFEASFNWITPIPNLFFFLQIPWPKEMIDIDCIKEYNGDQNFYSFEFSDNCGLISDLPLCPNCDYCPRTYKSCKDRNFRDFLDSILFILAWIPWWLNVLYFGGASFVNVQIYAFPVLFVTVLVTSPIYLIVVIPLFYIILWMLAGLFPMFQSGFMVITAFALVQFIFPSFLFNLQFLAILILALLLSWVPSLFVEYSYLTGSPVGWVKSLTSFMLKTPLFLWIPGLQVVRDRTDEFIYYNNDVPNVDVVCFFLTMSNMGMAVGGGYASYWILSQSGRLIIIFVIFILDILKALSSLIGEATNNDWQGTTDRRLSDIEKKLDIQHTETTKKIDRSIIQYLTKFKWKIQKPLFDGIVVNDNDAFVINREKKEQ